ncbi:hypothetical protein BCV70DRAFT_163578 [Testicularia cyperi]|uniref:Uncharacterized protein n=1 Tax=Testicularia cyperi TaxID=1882483 RepID=A0A317XLC9_9BASI|nr:hypothetical protein BCV70DRAFT_163578 [Testicularia cyperi]
MAGVEAISDDGDYTSDSDCSDATCSRSRPASPTTLFEDSLFSLFSHNQPAHGDPGDRRSYTHLNLPAKYNDSNAPNKPTRIRYRIAQNSGTNTKLFAHHQWDAGLYLADLIAEQSKGSTKGKERQDSFADVRGRATVELGAGTGLPGLVACLMGAATTVLTDYPDPLVIQNLQQNLDLAICRPNSARPDLSEQFREARRTITVQGLGWGNAEEEATVLKHSPGDQGFDIVLAADVLWVSSAHPLLIQSIRKLLKRSRGARCVLVAGFHTGRPAVRRFFLQLAQEVVDLDPERAGAGILPDWQAKHGGIWERNVDGSERPWSTGWIPSKTQLRPSIPDGSWAHDDEDMGDISDRGSWVVVASLRWADLE